MQVHENRRGGRTGIRKKSSPSACIGTARSWIFQPITVSKSAVTAEVLGQVEAGQSRPGFGAVPHPCPRRAASSRAQSVNFLARAGQRHSASAVPKAPAPGPMETVRSPPLAPFRPGASSGAWRLSSGQRVGGKGQVRSVPGSYSSETRPADHRSTALSVQSASGRRNEPRSGLLRRAFEARRGCCGSRPTPPRHAEGGPGGGPRGKIGRRGAADALATRQSVTAAWNEAARSDDRSRLLPPCAETSGRARERPPSSAPKTTCHSPPGRQAGGEGEACGSPRAASGFYGQARPAGRGRGRGRSCRNASPEHRPMVLPRGR